MLELASEPENASGSGQVLASEKAECRQAQSSGRLWPCARLLGSGMSRVPAGCRKPAGRIVVADSRQQLRCHELLTVLWTSAVIQRLALNR